MEACLEKTKAWLGKMEAQSEAILEETETVAEHQKVPNEETAILFVVYTTSIIMNIKVWIILSVPFC
jgi:hypothetical protein